MRLVLFMFRPQFIKNGMIVGVRILIVFLFALVACFPTQYIQATGFNVRPLLIDVAGLPRDVVTKTVVLKNDYPDRKLVVFATVNEISVDKSGEIKEFVSPVMTDRSVTMTSWIEVRRARIEIPAGEEIEVPITFRISPTAEPGDYHAFVGFVPTTNRPTAESIALKGEASGVVIKVSVTDKRVNSLRLKNFLIDRVQLTGDGVVKIGIENTGDLSSVPSGEIIFYDSRGVEVNSVPVNEESISIEPGGDAVLTAMLPMAGEVGKFKASLNLRYGENQRAQLQDATFFYQIPLYLLISVGVGALLVAIITALLFRRTFAKEEYYDTDGDEVAVYIRSGHDPNPMEHDIDLTKK
jgi:hypothetical protein